MTLLYSFRRCPYAMRARLALTIAEIPLQHCEVSLKDKPADMLKVSPKGTVPVLVQDNGQVLEESLEIMHWALEQNDPLNWLPQNEEESEQTATYISHNDGPFKAHLDKYKYAVRHPEASEEDYRKLNLPHLERLNNMLSRQRFLVADRMTLADAAVFPFVRQYAHVNRDWFYDLPFEALQNWLKQHLQSPLFIQIMKKR